MAAQEITYRVEDINGQPVLVQVIPERKKDIFERDVNALGKRRPSKYHPYAGNAPAFKAGTRFNTLKEEGDY